MKLTSHQTHVTANNASCTEQWREAFTAHWQGQTIPFDFETCPWFDTGAEDDFDADEDNEHSADPRERYRERNPRSKNYGGPNKHFQEHQGKPDFSVDNQWVEGTGNDTSYHIGAPYRKDVSPLGGSFQSIAFKLGPNTEVIPISNHPDYPTVINEEFFSAVELGGHNLRELAESKTPLINLFPNPAEIDVYSEIGLMY
jgi:hypothetical protein